MDAIADKKPDVWANEKRPKKHVGVKTVAQSSNIGQPKKMMYRQSPKMENWLDA